MLPSFVEAVVAHFYGDFWEVQKPPDHQCLAGAQEGGGRAGATAQLGRWPGSGWGVGGTSPKRIGCKLSRLVAAVMPEATILSTSEPSVSTYSPTSASGVGPCGGHGRCGFFSFGVSAVCSRGLSSWLLTASYMLEVNLHVF